jgi:hypothetical protein
MQAMADLSYGYGSYGRSSTSTTVVVIGGDGGDRRCR